ncbi:hypothetical protein P43SY_010594 [Pythium insidiosum]|uniref:ARM repeat-containing protein n=1 Tax=Pythium insidiosum TaxID=114742 RepID=A0AAD5LU79_PYTIN|nr:hypothetical protein P43SY_010594 [Pythium insidiosum]
MELSTAESALRTLKHRPKVPHGAVETSAGLLDLLAESNPESTSGRPALEQQELLERGLTTLLLYGKERWEPIAVVCAVVRDLLERCWTQRREKPEGSVDASMPFSQSFLQDVLRGVVRDYLEHYEPRVRMSIAKMLGAMARWDLPWVTREFTPHVIDSVLCNLTRSPDFEETGIEEFDDNVSVNGMESPTGGSSTPRSEQGDGFSPRTPTTPHRLDDVSGWKALESSLAAIKYIMKGSGATFLEQQDTMSGDKNAPFTYLTPEIWELITIKSVFHINRHVRVVGLDAITVLCELAPAGFLDSRRDLSDVLCKCIVRGMQDNWAQVRYAASHTTREFLLKLEPIAREDYFPMLVPRICLNRYYIAERVQKLSQETWRQLMGDRGREVVARYATEIVDYYIEMTSHCVREAACHCIAELATKVDAAAVRPHVPRLLDALLYSFRDSSWLVRDAACLASSQFVVAFPEESRVVLPQLYELWIDHLSDEIWSVREDAAVALGNAIRAYGQEALDRVSAIAADFLGRAKTQPAMSQQEYDELHRAATAHMSKKAFSCCSLEPKGEDDHHHEHREKQPWEFTDGAIYIVRELCAVAPEAAIALLPMVADVAILRHFPQTGTLQETVWKQVPLMCEALGKRVFKQYLEIFLDPMVFTLQGSHRLAKFAAIDCANQLSKAIGPSIFHGRLQANAAWLETIAPVVQTSNAPY